MDFIYIYSIKNTFLTDSKLFSFELKYANNRGSKKIESSSKIFGAFLFAMYRIENSQYVPIQIKLNSNKPKLIVDFYYKLLKNKFFLF